MKLIDSGRSSAGWSSIAALQKCARLWAFNQTSAARTATEAQIKGTLVHVGLAHYRQRVLEAQSGGDPDQWYPPVDAMLELAKREDEATERPPGWMKWAHILAPIIESYSDTYPELTIHSVETEYAASYGERVGELTARVDLVVWEGAPNSGGKLMIYDTKTHSGYRRHEDAVNTYLLSGQILHLHHVGLQNFGERFGGVVLDLVGLDDRLRRPLQRIPVPMNWKAVADFPSTVEHAAERMASLVEQYGSNAEAYPGAFHDEICAHTKYPRADGMRLCPHFERCRGIS